jgi:AIPR protein
MNDQVSFDDFREQWLKDVQEGNPSHIELGHRFAHKLFTQWRDISEASDDLVYCDGSGDGGIDLAYLERGESINSGSGETDNGNGGDTWYLVQSKYGSSFQGTNILLEEGQKVIETLDVGRERLSEVTGGVIERVRHFLRKADASSGDRLLFVFATERPLNEKQRRALDDVRAVGRERLGNVFDVESVSIETIYLDLFEDPTTVMSLPIRVNVEAFLADSGKDSKVGSIPLLKLYDFLKAYRAQTENLDQLYEKNVRRFLGGRVKVNKGMQATLNKEPEQFGLYNNGITIVVKDFKPLSATTYELMDPYIVNGCQTTRTIWDIFRQKLESGGKGTDPKLDEWKNKAKDGVVIAKIVRVGGVDEELLQKITRYTNSQNAVKEQDFVTLDEGFHRWKREIAERYGLFLEVQRGGWDSQKALQKQNPATRQYTESANAFDLLKVYGAGWLREAGTAFGRNTLFVPGGKLYGEITKGICVDDLYAAYLVQKAADDYDFGRGSRKISRRLTRYLFYMVVIDLLRDVLLRANKPTSHSDVTKALLRLMQNSEAKKELLDAAVGVVDEYLTQGEEDSVFVEPGLKERNSDLNSFLKWEQLGKNDSTPKFVDLMAINKRTMGRGNPSPRDLITIAIG